jgi:hypothetical protein
MNTLPHELRDSILSHLGASFRLWFVFLGSEQNVDLADEAQNS